MASEPATQRSDLRCVVTDCVHEGMFEERRSIDYDGHSEWFNLTLCGTHFLICESLTPKVFLARYQITRKRR